LRLREALRPLELRLLSLGATVEESLSTRLDSVRAPERLCDWDREEERLPREPELDRLRELVLEEERLLEPELDRPRELVLERFFEEELWEPPERLLRDRELCLGIRSSSSS
jgi:hypothetical protein